MIETLQWLDGRLRFVDQTRLPHETAFVETDDPAVVIGAIQELAIRGAPLIGIAGGYAAVLSARRQIGRPWDVVHQQWEAIARARPTAVNLAWAVERMRRSVQLSDVITRVHVDGLEREAKAIHDEDRAACERIAHHGVPLLPTNAAVLTHCNTGALATGGIGTALGIIRRGWESGKCARVFVDETRPLLQGARLTAWETQMIGIPTTLITDSMAAVLMQHAKVQAVIVGADRIARNGDVANKVGTYGLAVLAKAHGIPFYVAAPTTSIDLGSPDGPSISIEERHPDEVRGCGGRVSAPPGTPVFNPAFDVTPVDLVTAVITDQGVSQPPRPDRLASWVGTGVGR